MLDSAGIQVTDSCTWSHIYTKYKHTCTCRYNTTLTWILNRLILYNSTIWLLFCCIHLKQWYNKMSKKTLRVDANILSIANLAFGTPPLFFPFLKNIEWNLGSMLNCCLLKSIIHTVCVNAYKWSHEHYSISRQKCQHIYPTYIGIKPGISHIFVA